MEKGSVIKVASLLDPAIDLLAMSGDVADYVRTRDASLLKFKPGMSPAWYSLRRIPTSVYLRNVAEATTDADRRRRAFQMALLEAVDVDTVDGRKRVRIEPTGSVTTHGGVMPVLTDADLEAFAPATIEEIGGVADGLSFLAPSIAPEYSVPPSFLAALGAVARRDAVEAIETQHKNSEKAPEPQTTKPAPDSAEDGGAPATA